MGEHQERTTSHPKTCPKVKVLCPNAQCPASIPRCDVSTHCLTCDYEPVSCKYAEVGCEERPLRKDLKKHEEDDRLHLRMTKEKVLELSKMVNELTNQQSKSTTAPVTVKLINFQKHKTNKDEFHSPPFYTSPTGYKMCLSVYANGYNVGRGTHITVAAHLMKGDNDHSLTWPFTGTVTFELLNQLEDKSHHKKSVTFPAGDRVSRRVVERERGYGLASLQFISHTDLDQPDRNCQVGPQ